MGQYILNDGDLPGSIELARRTAVAKVELTKLANRMPKGKDEFYAMCAWARHVESLENLVERMREIVGEDE